jgi:pimeloyl-ACP methyl ester carboxylesterase
VSEGVRDLDLVYVPGFVSNIDLMWDEPGMRRFLERLAGFSRLILFDKRGTGLSDPVPAELLPTLEDRMDDVRAVMDAVGSERAALLGHSEGGNMSVLFAATYPNRTRALVLVGCYAKRTRSEDYPWAPATQERQRHIEDVEAAWGSLDMMPILAPSKVGDAAFEDWIGRYWRHSATPRTAAALLRMNTMIDIRPVLQSVNVPTLLLYREGDRDVQLEEGRYIASRIRGARLVELPGDDHFMWVGDFEQMLDEIEEFLTGARGGAPHERVLSTVLFTDIVGSTELAARIGDRAWRDLLNAITPRSAVSSRGGEVVRSRLRVTGSSRLSRPRARDPVRRSCYRGGPPARARDPGGCAYRRGRGLERRCEGDRGPHRCPRLRAGRTKRGARVPDRRGSRGGVRDRLRGSRCPRIEGRARRLGRLRRGRDVRLGGGSGRSGSLPG